MKYIILLIFIVSCSPERKMRKAEDKLGDIAVKYPSLLAKKARDLYPCVSTSDTIYTSNDSLFQEAILSITQDLVNQAMINDSLQRIIDNAVNVEPGLDSSCAPYITAIKVLRKQKDDLALRLKNIPPVHDTVRLPPVEDLAKLNLCNEERTKVVDLLTEQTKKTDAAQAKARNRGKIMWICFGLIFLIIGYNIYRIKNKITKL